MEPFKKVSTTQLKKSKRRENPRSTGKNILDDLDQN